MVGRVSPLIGIGPGAEEIAFSPRPAALSTAADFLVRKEELPYGCRYTVPRVAIGNPIAAISARIRAFLARPAASAVVKARSGGTDEVGAVILPGHSIPVEAAATTAGARTTQIRPSLELSSFMLFRDGPFCAVDAGNAIDSGRRYGIE